MTGRLALLMVVGAVAATGQYTYDEVDQWSSNIGSRWSQNGSVSPTYAYYQNPGANLWVLSFGGGGSLISTTPVSTTNPNDYEVTSTLMMKSAGGVGDYVHFLRASSPTVQLGSGSYISAEISIASGANGVGPPVLTVHQCSAGTVTLLASTGVAASDGATFRTIIFGTNLWVFVNNVMVMRQTVPLTTGNPGIGGYSQAGGNGFSMTELGHHDAVAPSAVVAHTIASSVFPTSVSLKWQGAADDAHGIGTFAYDVARNGQTAARVLGAEFADSTVTPGTTYTYSIQAVDYHGNEGPATGISVTTPPAGAIDPRRPGVFSAASYWGGGGEQMNMQNGDLHFSVPLLAAMGRNGWKVPAGIIYDSQNWRQDNGANWQLAGDVGMGFGWKMLVGSITPYYSQNWNGTDHFIYTDGTGAEYRLDQNNNGIWSSTQGVYVWFDANAGVLHFRDGSSWTMGCVSGGTEADAGTLYPTVIQDVSGNQITITYDTGLGLNNALGYGYDYNLQRYAYYSLNLTPNTSARIVSIADVRTTYFQRPAYQFLYDPTTYPVPHLIELLNNVGTGEADTFTYQSGPLGPPFGSDSHFAGLTTVHLASVVNAVALPWAFTYDAAGAGELTQVTYPWGGHLRWTYSSDAYEGGRLMRAVTSRYLAGDSLGATEWSYSITRDNAAAQAVHLTSTLADASGVGAKTWKFMNPASLPLTWQVGLAGEFIQSASAGGTIYTDDTYTWAQDPAGNPYIGIKVSVTDPGTGNAQTAQTTQTLDQYGNVTQAAIYPYNNTATPVRSYASTYLNSSQYTSKYIMNRLVNTVLTVGGAQKTLVQNSYDQNGLLQSSVTPAKSTSYSYNSYGTMTLASASDGTYVQAPTSAVTNYAAPDSITTQSYSENLAYTGSLAIAQATGLNGEQLSTNYDGIGRPTSSTSPYGATWGYGYSNTPPQTAAPWQTKTGPDGFTKDTLDGLGRVIREERGADSSHLQSVVDTVYAACACSPLGKVQKVSAPYPEGQSATNWTVYSYDGIGRTVTLTQPDGASAASYLYSGNQTKVTDPAGKWKQFTSDALGNLTTVLEPDPANQPGGTLTTTYTYDWMNHVSQVSMPRGSTTQTRSFVYSDAGLLTSATNPENGTVQYFYNADNTLQYKHDAKGQDTVYTYDAKKRVTMVQYFPTGKNNAWQQDTCKKVTYSYDTNPVNAGFSAYTQGRLTTAQYSTCTSGHTYPVVEMYSYHPAGGVTAKQMQITFSGIDQYGNNSTWNNFAEADYTYNTAGQLVTYGAAVSQGTYTPTFTYAYDTMGRPVSVTDDYSRGNPGSPNQVWASNAQYDFAGRLATYWTVSGGWVASTWNASGQMISQNWGSASLQYIYSGTQNNGQITQMVDSLSGETVSYQYDALKRLTSASSVPNAGSSVAAWTQTYQYDGFGNLTGKVLNGVTSSMAVNGATNQLTNAYYDANGNMISGAGLGLGYDEANRVIALSAPSGGTESYDYLPQNKRILRVKSTGAEVWTLWGAMGEKVGDFTPSGNLTPYVRFAGKVISENDLPGWQGVMSDRLGTNRGQGGRFYPYGDEITSTGNGYIKFATYTRDSYSGLDYADQRYYASGLGRFTVPDRWGGNGRNPGSLNKYAYVRGDPVNRNDPRGRCDVVVGGINQSSGNTSALTSFANSIGAIQAYPYANVTGSGFPGALAGILAGVGNVALQWLAGASGNTQAAYFALLTASQDAGLINIFTFSGGAQAFSSAYQYLPSSVQGRIDNISYVSPGSVSNLPGGSGSTLAVLGAGAIDRIATFATTVPPGTQYIDTPCGHDASCEFAAASGALHQQAGSACSFAPTISYGPGTGVASGNPVASPQGTMVESSIEIVSSVIKFGQIEDDDDDIDQ